MKKVLFIAILFAAVVLSGCAQKSFVCPDGTTVNDPSLCGIKMPASEVHVIDEPKVEEKIEQPKEEPKPEPIPEVKLDIDEETQKLFDKAKKITNYQIFYTAPKNEVGMDIYVKDNLVKHKFKGTSLIDRKREIYYDSFYFDTTAKTAYAYCAIMDCPSESKALKIDYDEYYIPILSEIIDDLTYTKLDGDERFDGRNTRVIVYEGKEGNTGRMWIDKYYGVPLKKVEETELTPLTWQYTNFIDGKVTDKMVELPKDVVILS